MKDKIIFLPKYMYPQIPKTNTKHNGGKIHNDNFTSGNMSCVPLFNVLQETSRLLKKMILITIRTMMLIVMVMLAMMLLNSSHLSIRRDPQWVGHPRTVPHLHKEDYLIVPPFCDQVFENIWKVFRWENRFFFFWWEKMKWWVGWVWGPIRAKAKCQSFVYLSCYFVCTTKKTANRPNLLILLHFLVSCLFCCCWKNPNLLKNDNDVGAPRYWWM